MDVKASELSIFDLNGKAVGTLALDAALWNNRINLRLLSQAVAMYRTNERAGTAATKKRGEVRGGGKKPWKQKHTGRARAGSNRSPLWRGGGIVFGPQPRDMHYHLPQKMRNQALLESLKGKLKDSEIVVVNELAAETPKTKPFAGMARTFKINGPSVIVLDRPGDAIIKSLRNLSGFELLQADNLNALDVLNSHKVVLTKAAFERLQERVKQKGISRKSARIAKQAPKAVKPAAKKERHASGH